MPSKAPNNTELNPIIRSSADLVDPTRPLPLSETGLSAELQRTQKAIDDINLQLYYQSPDVFSPKIEEVFTRMDEDSAKIKTECKSASIQTALSAYQGNYNDLVGIINRLVGA